MEQRRLRLGDILDDYCPRERRVTNHAIVAMIEEDVKQTRCTTCDAEHAYKGGKAPRRRKKETPGALYSEVLAGMPDADNPPTLAPRDVSEDDSAVAVSDTAPSAQIVDEPQSLEAEAALDDAAVEEAPQPDEGPVHRPLIRATLPRPEGQKDTRPLPEFTVRQNGRGGNTQFRGARAVRGRGGFNGNGNGNGNRMPRFDGARASGQGRGPAGRGAQGRGGQGGAGFRGRKRSR